MTTPSTTDITTLPGYLPPPPMPPSTRLRHQSDDLHSTGEADQAAAYELLTETISDITDVPLDLDDELISVQIPLPDGTRISVSLVYAAHGSYEGLDIGSVLPHGYTDGSWAVQCELKHLPRFLPPLLTPGV